MRRTSIIGISFGAMAGILMSAETYASFGVNNAIISSSDPVEHEQNMLALSVDVRDGDDSIGSVETPEDVTEGSNEELEEEGQEETEESTEQGEGGEDETTEGDFTPLDAPDAELVDASNQISEYANGFQEMRQQAIKAGLPVEVASRIESEYDANGELSEDSYAQLAKAGYSKGFVTSFIQGQEALSTAFVDKIRDYAGGKEQFDRVLNHLKANSPDSVDVLFDAIERQDLNSIRTVINLGMASQTKKFGKQPERTLNRRGAAPAGRQGPASTVVGFQSQNEMVKAMSDSRYGRDTKYTQEVEQKVQHAAW